MSLPPALEGVLERLAARRSRQLSPADLSESLRGRIDPAALLALLARADAPLDRPTRTVGVEGPTWTLSLAIYPPGSATPLHLHRAPGAFRVVIGHALEVVLGQPDRTWAADEVGEIPSGTFHQLGNPGADSLAILHLSTGQRGPARAARPAGAPRIAIVGGGLSAAALTYHLATRAQRPLALTVIERGRGIGRGIAYGVQSAIFRLNVPASRMSIDPDRPDDFVRWAGADGEPDGFLSRARFGAYCEERLASALADSPAQLTVRRDEAVSITARGVELESGRVVPADQVVLATGLVPRRAPAWLAVDPRIVDAWDEPALHALPLDGRLLVVGSGLSAIDVLGVIGAAGFRGRVVVLSRHALLPRPHLPRLLPVPPIDAAELARAPADLCGLLRWARAIVRGVERGGQPWQLGVDSLRPHIPRLWAALSPADRARFVRTVRPYWEVLRHRAPLDALAVIDDWRARDRLRLEAGRVTSCAVHPGGLEVELEHAGARRRDRFDGIVRCIGPALDDREGQTPLMASLLASGLGRADPAGLGLVTDEVGRVVGDVGPDRLFALGALRRAASWETTAVPQISRQAMALARHLLG